jgi:hypothetical protein
MAGVYALPRYFIEGLMEDAKSSEARRLNVKMM